MKILYSAANRSGSTYQLKRFLNHTIDKHDVYVAGWYQSTKFLSHNYITLDGLYYSEPFGKNRKAVTALLGRSDLPTVHYKNFTSLYSEVEKLNPELIVADSDPVILAIGKKLNIKCWSCSPLHLFDSIKWNVEDLKYQYNLYNLYRDLYRVGDVDKKLVYSPFGDIKYRPILKEGYEWVKPYHSNIEEKNDSFKRNLLFIPSDNRYSKFISIVKYCNKPMTIFSSFDDNMSKLETFSVDNELYSHFVSNCESVLSTGETSIVADAFYNEKTIHISPSLEDTESLLNAIMIRNYNLGLDLSQVELMDKYSLEYIEKIFEYQSDKKYLSLQGSKYIHELIDDLN